MHFGSPCMHLKLNCKSWEINFKRQSFCNRYLCTKLTKKSKTKFKIQIFNFLNHFFRLFPPIHITHTHKVWPFDLLFYAHLGQVRVEQVKVDKQNTALEQRKQPPQVDWLYETLFGTYLLVTIIILRKLLTCTFSDSYCRIQVSPNQNQNYKTNQITPKKH